MFQVATTMIGNFLQSCLESNLGHDLLIGPSSLPRIRESNLLPISAMQTASKNLMDTLSDIYEKEWVGQDMLYVQAQNHEMLWADVAHKLSDQVVIPLNTYQAQFPEMRVSFKLEQNVIRLSRI